MAWPTTEPTYGTYQWLMLGVGLYLEYDPDKDTYDIQENQLCNYIVQRGVRLFYNPPIPPAQDGSTFTWSFLNLRFSTTMVDDQIEYDLPATFGGRVDSVTWTGGGSSASDEYSKLDIVSEHELLALYGKKETPEGVPSYCAVRPKLESGSEDATADQVWELLVYPEPTAAVAAKNGVVIRFRTNPADLSPTNLYPRGNAVHAESLMMACLSIAELIKTKASGPCHERFMQQLQASMAIDMAIVRKAETDVYANPRPRP